MSRMFPFITKTWNPLGGECQHKCGYCWARKLAERYMHKKYQGKPRLITKEFARKFAKDDFVFVCDMCDLFGSWVPTMMILEILGFIERSKAKFLLLTKNPGRAMGFKLPINVVLGATIECDMNFKVAGEAITPYQRIEAMRKINHKKMVSIEPIMNFTPSFAASIVSIGPEFVAVGYDNYNNHLSEPPLQKTLDLISFIEDFGIKVYRKTLRKPFQFATSEKSSVTAK